MLSSGDAKMLERMVTWPIQDGKVWNADHIIGVADGGGEATADQCQVWYSSDLICDVNRSSVWARVGEFRVTCLVSRLYQWLVHTSQPYLVVEFRVACLGSQLYQ